jgi:predicted metal-binding protein
VCATPGSIITDAKFKCGGCNANVRIERLVEYLQSAKKAHIFFDTATMLYERARPVLSFGNWMIKRRYELAAKP